MSGSALSPDDACSSVCRPVAALAVDRLLVIVTTILFASLALPLFLPGKAFVCLVEIDHLDFGLANLNCLVRATTALVGAQLLINFATA